jgi:hypothetical protein
MPLRRRYAAFSLMITPPFRLYTCRRH